MVKIANTTPTVGMLVFRSDYKEVLMTMHKEAAKHQTGKYGIPAGRLDPGETETDALLREFNQETNLRAKPEDLTALPFTYSAEIKRKGEAPRLFSLKVWFCNNYSGEIKEMEENIPEWVSVSSLNKYDLLPNMEKVVNDAVKYLKSYSIK